MAKLPKQRGKVDRALLDATTEEDIARQIAEDPDTAPDLFQADGNENEYFRTSDEADVIGSLEHCLSCLEQVSKRPHAWKWATLAMHSALQGAIVCHLSGTANLGALEARAARDFLSTLRSEARDFSEWNGRLASFSTLLDRLFDASKRIDHGGSTEFDRDTEDREEAIRLNQIRDGFWHFRPGSWSLEIIYMLRLLRSNLNLIAKIAESGWAFRNIDPDGTKIQYLVQSLRTRLDLLEMPRSAEIKDRHGHKTSA